MDNLSTKDSTLGPFHIILTSKKIEDRTTSNPVVNWNINSRLAANFDLISGYSIYNCDHSCPLPKYTGQHQKIGNSINFLDAPQVKNKLTHLSILLWDERAWL